MNEKTRWRSTAERLTLFLALFIVGSFTAVASTPAPDDTPPPPPDATDNPLADFIGDYTGKTAPYSFPGKDGKPLVYKGRTLLLPAVSVEVLVNKDNLRLKQIADGSIEEVEEGNYGDLEIIASDQNSITVSGEFDQTSTTSAHYKFIFNKDGTAKMFPQDGTKEPTTDLIDKKATNPPPSTPTNPGPVKIKLPASALTPLTKKNLKGLEVDFPDGFQPAVITVPVATEFMLGSNGFTVYLPEQQSMSFAAHLYPDWQQFQTDMPTTIYFFTNNGTIDTPASDRLLYLHAGLRLSYLRSTDEKQKDALLYMDHLVTQSMPKAALLNPAP